MKRKTAKNKAREVNQEKHDQLELNMILARLKLPENKRTGFLRKRLPNGGSFL